MNVFVFLTYVKVIAKGKY